MLLLAYFVIDPTYNNKVCGQSHEKCAHLQWAFPDFLSFRALARPAVKPLFPVISTYHSKLQSLLADSKTKTQI